MSSDQQTMKVATSHNCEFEDVALADRIDEIIDMGINASVNAGLATSPLLRFKVLSRIISGLCPYAPGSDAARVREQISMALPPNAVTLLDYCADEFRESLTRLDLSFTYAATSYWSPLDRRRHTIAHRTNPSSEQERRYTLASLIAFYSLTHLGLSHDLYSVTQFTATKAKRKRGVPVCYRDDPGPSLRKWWHIPFSMDRCLLEASGYVDSLTRKLLNNSDVSNSRLEEALSLSLENSATLPWEDVEDFAEEFIAAFSERAANPSSDVYNSVLRAHNYLCEFFEEQLTFSQSYFMLLTHLIYREACPADFIYTFPVRVASTCCIMTIGVTDALSATSELLMGRVVSSVFYHPLLLDYAAKEASAHLRAERNALWERTAHLAAHRFRNTINPIENLVDCVRIYLDTGRPNDARKELESIQGSLERAKETLYEFRKLADLDSMKCVSLHIRPLVEAAANLAEKQGFVCDLFCSEDALVVGNEIRLTECFEELLDNSARWCNTEPKHIQISVRDADRARLPAGLDPNPPYTIVEFSDNGPGISLELKDRVFDEFYTTHPRGTGIGLAFVRRVLECHKGMAYVDVVPGAGAKLVFVIPKSV